MSVKDINNIKINIQNEQCNSFVTFRKDITDFSKMLKNKEIKNIKYNIEVEYR